MEEKIITIFCLVDDILKAMNVKDDKRVSHESNIINHRL